MNLSGNEFLSSGEASISLYCQYNRVVTFLEWKKETSGSIGADSLVSMRVLIHVFKQWSQDRHLFSPLFPFHFPTQSFGHRPSIYIELYVHQHGLPSLGEECCCTWAMSTICILYDRKRFFLPALNLFGLFLFSLS